MTNHTFKGNRCNLQNLWFKCKLSFVLSSDCVWRWGVPRGQQGEFVLQRTSCDLPSFCLMQRRWLFSCDNYAHIATFNSLLRDNTRLLKGCITHGSTVHRSLWYQMINIFQKPTIWTFPWSCCLTSDVTIFPTWPMYVHIFQSHSDWWTPLPVGR